MRDIEMGTGAVWSDPSKSILHFGSPPPVTTSTLVDPKGVPLEVTESNDSEAADA